MDDIGAVLFGIVLIVIPIIDVLRAKKPADYKVKWLAIIVLLPILGTVIYLAAGRYRR